MNTQTVNIRYIKQQVYLPCWQAMQQFTNQRDESTIDEIWLLEHDPVFTQGQNGKPEHILDAGNIPVIKVDRGGQITYHGPGQLVVYTLIDLKRKKFNVRELVSLLEKSIIDLLAAYHIVAHAKCDAPGVYIGAEKVCSVGLRIRRGCSYHGLAFNINMDMEPFKRINPCGYSQLKMTQLSAFGILDNVEEVSRKLINYLLNNLGYTSLHVR